MRSALELRSPSQGTGWSERWTFTANDERLLRDCLDRLEAFATDPPLEEWDRRRRSHVIRAPDRWKAAMLLWPEEPGQQQQISFESQRAEAAWTVEGAKRLAELLPDAFDDLRAAIHDRFGETDH